MSKERCWVDFNRVCDDRCIAYTQKSTITNTIAKSCVFVNALREISSALQLSNKKFSKDEK